jgi:hypothetical protein
MVDAQVIGAMFPDPQPDGFFELGETGHPSWRVADSVEPRRIAAALAVQLQRAGMSGEKLEAASRWLHRRSSFVVPAAAQVDGGLAYVRLTNQWPFAEDPDFMANADGTTFFSSPIDFGESRASLESSAELVDHTAMNASNTSRLIHLHFIYTVEIDDIKVEVRRPVKTIFDAPPPVTKGIIEAKPVRMKLVPAPVKPDPPQPQRENAPE